MATNTTENLHIMNLEDVQMNRILWLWRDWLPLGKMTILAGAAGCGKTNLALALASKITTGGTFPDGTPCEHPGEVLIFSTEDDPSDTLKPRLIANGADISKVSIITGCSHKNNTFEPFNPTKDFPKIEQYIKNTPNLKLLIIDPIVSAVSGDLNKANDVRRSLQPLVDLSNQYNFAILGITHFSKNSAQNSPVDRILGSQAFSAISRMAWTATRRDIHDDYILVRAKSNISTLEGGIRYQIECIEIDDDIETTATNWLGTVEGNAVELLNARDFVKHDSDSVIKNTKVFLIELLGSVESMSSKDVQSKAKDAGFSQASIRRARQLLDIKPFRPHGEKVWFWSLPQSHRSDHSTDF